MPQTTLTRDERRVVARNRIGAGPFVLIAFDAGVPYVFAEGMKREHWIAATERLAGCVERVHGLTREAWQPYSRGGKNENEQQDESAEEGIGQQGNAKGEGEGQ